ncbi:MAG: hypothetical protein M3Q96_02105 [Pseudomonadota bacterium]|nr:hypothetical protein [Pseudomonadota bacterium]
MNAASRHTASSTSGLRALLDSFGTALQWRLLLLWLLMLLLPTLLIALPATGWLQGQFGHSIHAGDIAGGRNLPLLLEGLFSLGDHVAWLSGSAVLATVVTLLLSPWLNGMVIASIRAGRRLGFGELLQGGLAEYGRMFRTLLWSVLPLGIALGIGAGLMGMAGKKADTAIMASDVEGIGRIMFWTAVALFVLIHASVEVGRGWFGADPTLRSAIRAWWRGCKLLLRRPIAVLAVYLGTMIAGYGLAALLGMLRLQFNGASAGGFVVAVLLTQLVIAALVWARIARLYGMAALAGDALSRQAVAVAPRLSDSYQAIPPAG